MSTRKWFWPSVAVFCLIVGFSFGQAFGDQQKSGILVKRSPHPNVIEVYRDGELTDEFQPDDGTSYWVLKRVLEDKPVSTKYKTEDAPESEDSIQIKQPQVVPVAHQHRS